MLCHFRICPNLCLPPLECWRGHEPEAAPEVCRGGPMPGMRCRRISALFSPSPHPRLQHLDEFRQVRDLVEVEPGQIPDEIRLIFPALA